MPVKDRDAIPAHPTLTNIGLFVTAADHKRPECECRTYRNYLSISRQDFLQYIALDLQPLDGQLRRFTHQYRYLPIRMFLF